MNKIFPAIALYANSHGNGTPILNSDGTINEEIAKAISRFQLLTLNVTPFDGRADTLVNLRIKNPNIKIVAYSLLMDVFFYATPGTFWKEMYDICKNQVNGLLYATDGSDFTVGYRVNFGNIATTNALIELWKRRLIDTGIWDGLFLDLASTDIAWTSNSNPGNKLLDYVRAGFSSLQENDRARRESLSQFCSSLRTPTNIMIGNGTTPVDIKNKLWDGNLFEGWPFLQGGFDNAMKMVSDIPKLYNMMEVENYEIPYSDNWNRMARLGLATACMNDTYFCYGPARNLIPAGKDNITYLQWWPDEYAVTPYNPGHTDGRHDPTGQYTGWLGEAVSAPYKDVTGALIRKFPKGLVILNQQTNSVTVDLGAPYWRRIYGIHDPVVNNGKTDRYITIPGSDGLFLISIHKTQSSQNRRI